MGCSSIHTCGRIGSGVWSTLQAHPPYERQMRRSGAEGCTTSSSGEAYTRFFRMRPTCIGEMDGTISNSTTLSDSSRSVHLPRPSGGALHAVAMIFASTSPVHLAGTGGDSRFFRMIVDLSPSVAYFVRTFCTVVGDVLKAAAASITVIGFFPFLSTARRMLACNMVRADFSPDFTSLVSRLRSAAERLTSYFCIGITVTC